MLKVKYHLKVKHIIEIPLDEGPLRYKNIYFLMYWHKPKENVIKLVSV